MSKHLEYVLLGLACVPVWGQVPGEQFGQTHVPSDPNALVQYQAGSPRSPYLAMMVARIQQDVRENQRGIQGLEKAGAVLEAIARLLSWAVGLLAVLASGVIVTLASGLRTGWRVVERFVEKRTSSTSRPPPSSPDNEPPPAAKAASA